MKRSPDFQAKVKSDAIRQIVMVSLMSFVILILIVGIVFPTIKNLPLIVVQIMRFILPFSVLVLPWVYMRQNQESFLDYFKLKGNQKKEIIIGLLCGLSTYIIFGGLFTFIGQNKFPNVSPDINWLKMIYGLFYYIFSIALTEEILFRGFIFNTFLKIRHSRGLAIAGSSILFGLYHISHGSLIQVIVTGLMGFIYCMFREKIKGCTLLSLIIAHGFHNWLIDFVPYIIYVMNRN